MRACLAGQMLAFFCALTATPLAMAQVPWARANPAKASFGSPGAGSLPHFFGLLFARSAGVEMVHVPFKGGAPLVIDLVGGHVAAGVSPVTDYLEQHRNGKLRLLATSGDRRSAPGVATFVE